jgi:protein-tyrosine phosphatase
MRILFVCIGNICRSPIAHGLLEHKVEAAGLDWVVDSAGTEGYHIGEQPHLFSRLVCMEHGLDISAQKARRFSVDDLDKFDIVYAMANDVLKDLERECRLHGVVGKMNKVKLFLNELHPGKNADVPDPWYGPQEGYLDVYNLIDEGTDAIMARHAGRPLPTEKAKINI